MDYVPQPLEYSPTPQDLQNKVYSLLEQLQTMASELPAQFQQRLSCELLSSLANCLLNDTIFEIVKGLMDIQHVTEKYLFQQRLQLLNQQKIEMQDLQKIQVSNIREEQKSLLQKRHRELLKQHDMKIIMQLDQKVSDQQVVLEKAGVPGFYVTNNPVEIKVQVYLLAFILRLGKLNPSSPKPECSTSSSFI